MSYNKLGFTKGQVLKAEHLNHIEEGIFNTPKSLVIKVTQDNYAYVNYRHCYTENYDAIYDVLMSGGIVWLDNSDYIWNTGNVDKFILVCSWSLTPNGLELHNIYSSLLCPDGSHTPTEWDE